MGFTGNVKTLVGTNGRTWVNSQLVPFQKMEVKIQAKTDNVVQSGQWFEGTNITGATISGTLTLNKENSFLVRGIFKGICGQGLPDIKVIHGMYDPATGQTERWSFTGIVFTELTNSNEPEKNVSQELPFVANNAQILETID